MMTVQCWEYICCCHKCQGKVVKWNFILFRYYQSIYTYYLSIHLCILSKLSMYNLSKLSVYNLSKLSMYNLSKLSMYTIYLNHLCNDAYYLSIHLSIISIYPSIYTIYLSIYLYYLSTLSMYTIYLHYLCILST